MKYIKYYNEKLKCNNDEDVFDYLIKNMKETIRGWNFFVAWSKIIGKVSDIEMKLNILNYLIGKENIKEEFKIIIKKYSEVIEVIPILIACRDKNFKILDPMEENIFNYKSYSFKKKTSYSDEDIEKISEFADKIGLLEIFKQKNIKNVVDYVIGIEVGLDTNARKNRSGTDMEFITELFIKKLCEENAYNYITQATSDKIKRAFNYEIIVDVSDRKFDFAINTGRKLYLLETNYYSGGGTKLKSVAGEFTSVSEFIRTNNQNHGFIWITDGLGWKTAKHPLKEAFNKMDYILNLNMIEKGILNDIVVNNL